MIEENKVQALVNQAKSGEQDAFGQLYDMYSERIYKFLFFRLRHKETAEDILHTVFLKAWTNITTYQQQGAKFSTWLFQIANFTLIDHWRTRKETVEINKVENLSLFAVPQQGFEHYDYLWQAIMQLPDEYKTVIELRFKNDLSVTETAHVLNRSQVAVRVLQHRALKALKQLLIKRGQL